MIDRHSWRASLCGTALVFALIATVQGTEQNAATRPAQKSYTLGITKEGPTMVALTATDAKVSEIAADLAKRLGAQVIVGPSFQDEKITTQFAGSPLELALVSIAPHVLIDYEVRQDAPPAPLGIYLLGNADPDPSPSAVVRGTSQGMMVSGNTEDLGAPPPADAPLRVIYDKGRLTVFAKRQPLVAVLLTIADTMGVPAEIKRETTEIVDANIKDTPQLEEAIAGLSPNVRVYVRADVTRFHRTLLRLVIVPPPAKQ